MYRTLGWPKRPWPLNEERIDEATSFRMPTAPWTTARGIMEHELAKKNWNLFVSVYETTDRFQHISIA